MRKQIKDRFDIWKEVAWRPVVGIVNGLLAIYGILVSIRDFFPNEVQQKYQLNVLLPHWSWRTWLISFLSFNLVLLLEGAYRAVQKANQEWQKRVDDLTRKLAKQATDEEIKCHIALLTTFIDRGQKFISKCRTQQDLVPQEDVQKWAYETMEIVARIFDPTYISRFESGIGVPIGAAYWPNLGNRQVDGFVKVRVYRLQQFIDELKDQLKLKHSS